MVISVIPHARDSFNDLSTLTIEHANGRIETPNRAVNRYDLSAKDRLGADIPLTGESKSFLIQESLNPQKLERVLRRNGYLGELLGRFRPVRDRVGSGTLTLLYPSLTKDGVKFLDSRKKRLEFAQFFCSIAEHMELESIMLSTGGHIHEMAEVVSRHGLQLVPVLDLKEETSVFETEMKLCAKYGSRDIPIIGLKFARYSKANKAYDHVMDNFESIHDKHKQAVMMVDAPRALYSEDEYSVSAPHYGSFFTADLSAEGYASGGGSPEMDVRLFHRGDLATPKAGPHSGRFDVEQEKRVFSGDPKLAELLEKIATGALEKEDWRENRPRYLSRVHENARTRTEFGEMRRSIGSDSARDYLAGKRDMDTVVTRHLESGR